MAPRRGGSYGGGISISSCSDYAFQDKDSIVYMAFYAVFCFVFIALLFVALGSSRTWRKGRGVLFQPLLWSIVFMIITLILCIVFDALDQCQISYAGYGVTGYLASYWTGDLSKLLLVGMIMLPLSGELRRANGNAVDAKKMIHMFWFGLTVLMVIAYEAISTAWSALEYDLNSDNPYNGYSDNYEADKLSKHVLRMAVAADAFVVVGLLLACADVASNMTKRSSGSRVSPVWNVLLIIGSLGFSVCSLAGDVYTYYGGLYKLTRTKIVESLEVQYFLWKFFFALATLSALKVASNLCAGLTPGFVQPSVTGGAQPQTSYQYEPVYHQSTSSPPPPDFQSPYRAYSPPPNQPHFQSGFSNEIRAL